MRRAAISIPSNIAEGYGRWSRKEYAHFCRIAFGSASELETQLILAKRLNFASKEAYSEPEELLRRTQMLLNRLIRALTASSPSE